MLQCGGRVVHRGDRLPVLIGRVRRGAAKAYKHDAFAARLEDHATVAERVQGVLQRADARLAGALAVVAPKAQRFIDKLGHKQRPTYTPPSQPSERGTLSDPSRGTVRSRHAGLMAALWTLRYRCSNFGYEACAIPESSSYEAIAVTLGTHLGRHLETAAADISHAYATALSCQPPAERARLSK